MSLMKMVRLLAAGVALSGNLFASERPEILMIAIDDLRPMLGCYGDPHIQTPNIDRLAARGVLFERAYCQYAKCGTSRLSLMTGLRPDAIGVFSNNDRDVKAFRKRRPEAVSMARWLKEAGYEARGFGKIYHDGWDLESDWSAPPRPGREAEILEVVDEKDPAGPTLIADRMACPVMQRPDVGDEHLFAGRMTTEVIELLRSDDGVEPLFVAVGYRRPHLPFVAPKKYWDLYAPDDSWLAANPEPGADAPVMAFFNSDGYGGSAKKVGLTMPLPPTREEAIAWNGYEMRSYLGVPYHGEIERSLQLELRHAYAACVSYVDAQIGRLLDALEESGRLDEMVVVLWSDHGWHLGEQSAWGKMTNFELGTRVPFIVAGPGIAPGRTKALAELVDLYPTLCELAGVEAPGHLEGESLVPVLRAPEEVSAAVATSQYARYGTQYMGRALRTDRYRYVAWTEEKTGEIVERELYDHRSDPEEMRNLAGVEGREETVAKMERRLREEFEIPKDPNTQIPNR